MAFAARAGWRCWIVGGLALSGWVAAAYLGSFALEVRRDEPQLPLRTVYVTFDEGRREAVLDRLRTFADANLFAIRVDNTTPDGQDLLIQMWRNDLQIVGVNDYSPRKFAIPFYENQEGGAAAISSSDRLAEELRDALSQVEGAKSSLER